MTATVQEALVAGELDPRYARQLLLEARYSEEEVDRILADGQLSWTELRRILSSSRADIAEAVGALPKWHEPAGPEATAEELEARELSADTPEVPSRRALEALLAADAGEPEAPWRDEHAETSWGALHDQLQSHETLDIEDALEMERSYQAYDLEHGGLDALAPAPLGADLESLIEKQPVGAQSGALENYTRPELCKRLGYLQRDARDWSDDDLRAMALDAGVVPRFVGSPSHTSLAAAHASRFSNPKRRANEFRKAMKAPYARLNRSEGKPLHNRPDLQHDELERTNPLLARTPGKLKARRALMHSKFAVPPVPYRPAPGAQTRAISSLDHRYGGAFRGMGKRLNGMHLSKVVGHGSTGTWRSAARGASNSWGIYVPDTGEIHLNPRIDKLVSKAQRGRADAREVYAATHTLAHELLHACSAGRGDATGAAHSVEAHTLEEGGTESLARLHTDALARDMELWSEDELLRSHASVAHESYPAETETMVALASACSGDLDIERLRSGAYQQPEALSPDARAYLTKLHTEVPLRERSNFMAATLQERHGLDERDARALVRNTLIESKAGDYKWRLHETVSRGDAGQLTRHREYTQPAKLSDGLARLLSKVGRS